MPELYARLKTSSNRHDAAPCCPGDDLAVLRWLFFSWIANTVALGVAAVVLHGVNVDGSAGTLFVAAIVFGVLNTILKPILKLVTLPFAVLTLGIVWFFVSMLMLWLTDLLVGGFDIKGFGTYIWATIIVWAVNLVVDNIFHRQSHGRRAAAAT
jgi:putative membrane protein